MTYFLAIFLCYSLSSMKIILILRFIFTATNEYMERTMDPNQTILNILVNYFDTKFNFFYFDE